MKKILLPACLAVLSLSACADFFVREGVGFTGIDGEPKTFSEAKGSADYVTRQSSVPARLATLPPVRLRTDSADVSALAGAALEAGGRTPANAAEVGGTDRTLYLSTVEVNGVLFAVLRTREGDTTRMASGAGDTFLASVPRLTGCLASGPAYQNGKAGRRTTAYAVPLNCS
ncbi:hypothetical protein [Falsiruegeria mediterranea]|jgi:hypothetical protein|uniref:Lipoprotein n=1 Tax=Falsiruegeria mediterranea M17 TaxID=1200281 RepID=A0A2R8C806_9RHOB|nr:hypothetical protein [Falsiruegeria mediterranea]SPJ28569.1 hypothetical protein TRM7615_02071 [Falsiruegeria mediterranea M17]